MCSYGESSAANCAFSKLFEATRSTSQGSMVVTDSHVHFLGDEAVRIHQRRGFQYVAGQAMRRPMYVDKPPSHVDVSGDVAVVVYGGTVPVLYTRFTGKWLVQRVYQLPAGSVVKSVSLSGSTLAFAIYKPASATYSAIVTNVGVCVSASSSGNGGKSIVTCAPRVVALAPRSRCVDLWCVSLGFARFVRSCGLVFLLGRIAYSRVLTSVRVGNLVFLSVYQENVRTTRSASSLDDSATAGGSDESSYLSDVPPAISVMAFSATGAWISTVVSVDNSVRF
jgi:hypothetical protein